MVAKSACRILVYSVRGGELLQKRVVETNERPRGSVKIGQAVVRATHDNDPHHIPAVRLKQGSGTPSNAFQAFSIPPSIHDPKLGKFVLQQFDVASPVHALRVRVAHDKDHGLAFLACMGRTSTGVPQSAASTVSICLREVADGHAPIPLALATQAQHRSVGGGRASLCLCV